MINIKLTNFVFKNIVKSYNDIKEELYFVFEKDNPYGHVREFIKLSKKIQFDAHRVISPVALFFAKIEIAYSVTDINGNTYKFDIFEDGDYRISEVIELNDYIKEVAYERNPNKDC